MNHVSFLSEFPLEEYLIFKTACLQSKVWIMEEWGEELNEIHNPNIQYEPDPFLSVHVNIVAKGAITKGPSGFPVIWTPLQTWF